MILVFSVTVIFILERKFLVKEMRGATISKYEHLPWQDNILLLVDDFEGLGADSSALQKENFFCFGSVKIDTDTSQSDSDPLASKTVLKVEWNGKENYGGWGKGIGKNMDLNTATDHLNFRIYIPKTNGYHESIKITLEEDDNNDGTLQKDLDDSWFYKLDIAGTDSWHLISIPLKDFSDANEGGDGILNISRKGGIHTIIFSFEQVEKYTLHQKWYFDFICFTNEKITDSDKK
jgi:hypothetical protein